jgi:hypothetical protein
MVMQAATVAVQMPKEGAMPDRGENDPAQMFQQIMQQLTQGAPDTFDFTRDPKAGGMAPADTFDFTTKPTAPEPYIFKLPPDLLISSVHPSAAGTRDGGIIIDFTPGPEAESPTGRTDGVFTVVLPSVPAVQDDGLLLPAVQTGGVSVACGDVNGDTSALGDPITFTYTVRNTSSAYEGTHALYQDVVIPSTAPEPGEVWDWNKKVMDGDIGGSIDFQPQLTSEPTAAEAGHVKVFSGLDTSEPTAAEPQERYTFVFDGYANTGDGGSFDDLAVDPSNPNAGRTDGVFNLVLSSVPLAVQDDGLLLPAVQTDDGLLLPY